MQFVRRPTASCDDRQRARFDILRRHVFAEMERSAARWRLAWIVPFHLLVVALLVVRGESSERAALQGAVVAMLAALFVARVFWSGPLIKTVGFLCGIAGLFVLLATTGGLESPLILGLAMMLFATATILEPRWLRGAAIVGLVAGFVALALLSRSPVGQLAPPLVDQAGHVTAEYVTLALLSAACATMGIYKAGCRMTRGYEQAALELAERREELCSENEDRTRALEGMAARLAHEVKNPLAAIKGLSAHMARHAADPKTAERLAIVAAEADRLQSIVDGFLSFSRGLDDLKLAPTRPFEVARELAVLLETRAEEAGVKLEVAGDEALVLDADGRKLRQALLNLVLNAVQASPRGAAVRITVARDGEGARITVRDDGVGMTPEVLERIRKPYFTTKEGGTGLGVAVARGLVEQHGGRIELKSAAGKGTTASIVLPTKAKPCAILPNLLRRASGQDPGTGQGEAAAQEPAAAGVR
jgi:signal transduction histidine kinase